LVEPPAVRLHQWDNRVNKALWSALDAATRRSELNEAARKLMQAKTALKRLEQKAPTAFGAAASAASS